MAQFKTIHTKYGLQRMAQAEASGVKIVLTHMAVGDGNGNPVTPGDDQTFLARERDRRPVNRVFQDPALPSMFTAEMIVPAEVGGFTIREIGIFDDQGGLFAIANVPDTYKPLDTEGAFSDTVIRMVFAVTNAEVVTLVIDPNVATATHTWVINNVNATTIIPGGLVNQVLAKKSNASGDVEWRDPNATVDVSVSTREETQTLADAQVIIDLAVLTTEGLAVYIEGTRLRNDEFTVNSDTRITLDVARAAGTKATLVQNEQTGLTQILFRVNNLADVPDKAAARSNLGIPNAIATASINWSQLIDIPAFASRWPNWGEVSGKPATFAPSAHRHAWSDLDNLPVYTTRWPAWSEVSGKPGTFTPAAHLHIISDVTGLQGALDGKASISGQVFAGQVAAPSFKTTSSRAIKHGITSAGFGLAHVERLTPVRFYYLKERDPGQREHVGLIAEDVRSVVPQAVGYGDGIPCIDYAQLTAVLIGAVQELAARVRTLEAKG